MIDGVFRTLRDETNKIIGSVMMLDGKPEWNTAEFLPHEPAPNRSHLRGSSNHSPKHIGHRSA